MERTKNPRSRLYQPMDIDVVPLRARRAGYRRYPSYFGPGRQTRVPSYGRFGVSSRRAAIAPELKFLDTAVSFTADNTYEVPATGQLCLIPQGTTESTRIGRKVVVKSIQARLRCTNTDATAPLSMVTVWLVQDTQCNGAAATFSDVFTTGDPQGLRKLVNVERFRILKRWDVKLQAQAGVSGAYEADIAFFDCFIKCNIPLEFNGATGAITEIKSNNIFLLAGSLITDDIAAVGGNIRIKYTDN